MGTTPQPHLSDASDDVLASDDAAGRRSFLKKVAIGGAAAAVGGQLLSVPAFAQDEGESDGADDETPALSADEEAVAFLASLSLAASAVYRTTTGDEPGGGDDDDEAPAETTTTLTPIEVPALAEPVVEVLRGLGAQQAGQAAAFAALLPETAPTPVANGTLLGEVRIQLGAATDEAAVLGILADTTERIAATQMAAIGTIEDVNDTKVVAAALPVLGEHVVVLGQITTPPVELVSLIPVEQPTDGALTPAAYPVEAGPSGEGSAPATPDANAGGEGAEPGDANESATGEGTESDSGATDTESEG